MPLTVSVIGAGLVGSAVAAALAEAGCAVTVLAADPLGSDTSAASLSWLNAARKPPASYTAMNIEGMRSHADYARRHGDAPWFHRGGNLRFCFDEAEAAAQERILDQMKAFDYPGGWIGAQEVLELEPDLDPGLVRRAQVAFFPGEGWINGPALVGRLLADARAAGARVMVPARVTGFDLVGGRIAALRLEGGERLEADVCVNCAGPAAGRLAAEAGCTLPMANEVGAQVYTAPAATTLGRVIHSRDLNMRPDGAGRICLHDYATDRLIEHGGDADDTSAAGYRLDPAHVAPLLDRLGAFYPAAAGVRAEAVRIGMRPIPQDRRPVMGFLDGCANLYAAVMHSGATLALRAGELAAREIAGGETVADLADFRPSRFAGRAGTEPTEAEGIT